jgi:hypothetical protein
MKNNPTRQAKRRRRRPEISKLTASTIVERQFRQKLENQARMYSVELDFLMERILEMGLVAWTHLEPYQVQALVSAGKRLEAKRVSSSLLLGDSQPFNERRIN